MRCTPTTVARRRSQPVPSKRGRLAPSPTALQVSLESFISHDPIHVLATYPGKSATMSCRSPPLSCRATQRPDRFYKDVRRLAIRWKPVALFATGAWLHPLNDPVRQERRTRRRRRDWLFDMFVRHARHASFHSRGLSRRCSHGFATPLVLSWTKQDVCLGLKTNNKVHTLLSLTAIYSPASIHPFARLLVLPPTTLLALQSSSVKKSPTVCQKCKIVAARGAVPCPCRSECLAPPSPSLPSPLPPTINSAQ